MGLFQRDQQRRDNVPAYTITIQGKTRLIVGLGNVGEQYARHRHNVGFMALDTFENAQGFSGWREDKKFHAAMSEKPLLTERILLAKPTTLMNRSGDAVQAIAQFYKLNAADILLIYDDKDIPFGTIRTRQVGSSGGHNGLKSVFSHMGDSMQRIRIGIANEHMAQHETADFVLQNFTKDEVAQLPMIFRSVTLLIQDWLSGNELPNQTIVQTP